MATRSEDYYQEDDEDSYNYKKTILKMGKMKTVEKTRKMKVVKKVIVKMRKIDNCMYNYDVDYNDDECEDIGKVRQRKIGQEDEENED